MMRFILAASAALFATSANAHHVMGGEMPQTFMQGFLSGLGHPVIGLDHFAFVVAAGLIASAFSFGWALPLAFLVCGAVGAGLHLYGVSLDFAETLIALSVLLLGLVVAIRKPLPAALVVVLFGAAGFFHGYALMESMFGAEKTPLVAYCIGMVAIQYGVALGAMFGARWLIANKGALGENLLRAAGGLIALFGLALASGLA